jgi:hypothetical protein
VTGFPLMPFERFTARIFLLVSLTSHSLKIFRTGRKVIFALCAVNAVIDCNETDVFLWENYFTDMDKTTKNYAELLTTNSNMPWSKKQSALLLLIAFLLLIAIYRSYIVYFLLHLCADM